uniref:C2H2-type domain-containing protein n=1 Tax=Magallana gigas TaxID=29159 RepID=A0A8W8NY97_MAGGI
MQIKTGPTGLHPSGKRKTDYAKVLSVLLDHMARQPTTAGVIVDIEEGIWKTVRETINAEIARQRSLKLPYTLNKLCYKLPSGKTVVIKLVDNLRSAQKELSKSSSSTQQGNGDESSSCDEICCSSIKTATSQENSKSNTETTAVKSEDGFTVIRREGLKKTKFNGITCANKDKGISNSTVEKLANENVIWKQEISNSNTIDPKQNHPVNYQCIPKDRNNDSQETVESEGPNLASRRQPVVLKRNLSHSHETAGSAEHRFESRKQPVVVLERIKVESNLTVSNIPEELGKNMQEGCSENIGNINLSEDSVAGTLLDVNTEECSTEFSKQGMFLRGVKKHYTRSSVQQKTKQSANDHQGEFECGECGRKFLRKDDVMKHMLKHTGESMYTCEVCGKGSGSKQALQKHINIHTGDDIELNVTGSSSSSFSTASSLGMHENLTVDDH